ncbi:hypothetical protein M9458_055665 [Cirrhinus mrigala]|uniref:DUF4939 domain-containing protein n=1 Tax=Cirrhinus mrigala TaxID=683832 RepID=A0ABD0MHC8_CIRMR
MLTLFLTPCFSPRGSLRCSLVFGVAHSLELSSTLHFKDKDQTYTNISTKTPAASDPLAELVNAFKAAFQPTPAPPSALRSPMAMPATFAGETAECSGFLLQVNLYIQVQPQQFPLENAQVTFLTSLLTSKALQWAKAIWNSDNPIIHSYEQFTSHFSEVFSTATGSLTTSDQLFRLQQCTSSVNDYTLHFRTLVAASSWNKIMLLGAYRQGLNPDIRAAMALYDDSIGLESFLQRTTRVSQRLAPCQPSVKAPQSASVAASFPVPELMQIDATRLSRTERSSGNFISQDCLNQLQLSCRRHFQVFSVKTIQRKPLGHGTVRYSSPFITLQVGLFHKEEMRFLVLEDSTLSIILGCPWLRRHRPELSREPCDVIRWSEQCHTQCLVNLPHPRSVPVQLSSTQVESPEPSFTPENPTAFQDVPGSRI